LTNWRANGEIMKSILVLLLIIGIIGGLLWMIRAKHSPTRRRASNTQKYEHLKARDGHHEHPGGIDKLKANSLFWGVEMGQPGCEAAQALLGKQYTFEDAPQLPLDGCSSAMCTCQFKGLKNNRNPQQPRRTNQDRRNEVRFDADKPERRSRKNRRRSDSWDDHSL
jgi:hypothetical protein